MSRRPSTSPGYIPTPEETKTSRISRKPVPSIYGYPQDDIHIMKLPIHSNSVERPLLDSIVPGKGKEPDHCNILSFPRLEFSLDLDYPSDDEFEPVISPPRAEPKEVSVQRPRASTFPSAAQYVIPKLPTRIPDSVQPLQLAGTSSNHIHIPDYSKYAFPFSTASPVKYTDPFSARPHSYIAVNSRPAIEQPRARRTSGRSIISQKSADDRIFFPRKADRDEKDSDEITFDEFWSEGFNNTRTSLSSHEGRPFFKRKSSSASVSVRNRSGSSASSKLKGTRRASHIRFSIPSVSHHSETPASAPPPTFNEHNSPTAEELSVASRLFVISQSGVRVRFDSLWQNQKTIVIFIRHFLCPQCQDYMFSISRNISSEVLKEEGIKLVIIGNGHYNLIKSYRRIFRTPFDVYTDPTREVYSAMGMTRQSLELGPEAEYSRHGVLGGVGMVVANAIKVGMPVWKNHGATSQLGGEFILGPGMECTFAHRMPFTRAHLPILDVVQAAGVDMVTPLNAFTQATGKTFLGIKIEREESWIKKRKDELRAIIVRKDRQAGNTQCDTNCYNDSESGTDQTSSTTDLGQVLDIS